MGRYHCARCSSYFEGVRRGKEVPKCPWCKNNHMVESEMSWEKFKREVGFTNNKAEAARRDARIMGLIKKGRRE